MEIPPEVRYVVREGESVAYQRFGSGDRRLVIIWTSAGNLDLVWTYREHDPDRPWIVIGSEHRTAKLDDAVSFFAWARERWPEPRWTVELDPWQLTPRSPSPRTP